ncbi:tRNA nucleotidyltransferase (CCA-adding enzyme) [Humidesulfovibrio mexicanus]|uniref:tRNA nucleotidyltransferase (CCA-adding enzyme) n=1 Tax=Humidesulfovibrio mexicanus TaxID=147047 RepID=A0A239D2A5_9BACT|nr:CBS domain-containing protein [Humidesulfovibrio mexicanus]SNS25954.1 tRNA nucleotidyltransferase (CCA-adding enzyme) [Humidesulfovibrio mexicanus]
MNAPAKPRPRAVITAHANADFDALAAIIAASRLYPGAALIFPGSQEKNLRNFYIQSTTYLFNFRAFKDIDPTDVELLVIVDTRQKSRVPHVQALLDKPGIRIHVYDHHPDTEEDVPAEYSLVKSWGSTTTIIIHELMSKGITPSVEEATVLGLGIFEDTGSFAFNSTTPEDFDAAAWLRRHGMDLGVISDLLARDLSSEQIRVLSEMIESAKTHDFHGIEVTIAEVSTEEFISDFAYLVHKFIDMENVRVMFALGRMGDRIHIVARSRASDVNVGFICSFFGGGGHGYAASATVKDKTLSEVRDELLALLYSHINPQITAGSLMTKPPKVIDSDRPMADAAELMTRFGLKSVAVVMPGTMRCVGLLDQRTADKAVGHGLKSVPLAEYMVTDFTTAAPTATLHQVMEIVIGKRQRFLPVVENGMIIGVITRTDLVNLLVEESARIPETLLPDPKRDRNIRSVMRTRLPGSIIALLEQAGLLAKELGYKVYAVGGFVRDILLARPNLDIDLVVEGDGIRFAHALSQARQGRVKEHQKFKTAVVVFPDGQRIDVATARLEYYEYPTALPTVELSSIKMDLYRRDFSINALALNLSPGHFGQLMDFFGSQRDIKEKTIRVLHSLSFVEDPTRILRAVRFEQRFNFRIDGQTLRLIKNAVQLNLFSRLSGARIAHELQLILDEENVLECLSRLQDLKLLAAIHPQLHLDADRTRVLMELRKVHDWYRLLYLEPPVNTWKLYMLGLTMGAERDSLELVCRRLRFSDRELREFLALRDLLGESLARLMTWAETQSSMSDIYFALDPLPVEGVLFLMARSRREIMRKNISQYLTRLRTQELLIDGSDLKIMGLKNGPNFARVLRKVRAAAIDGAAVTRDKQVELAKSLIRGLEPGGSGTAEPQTAKKPRHQ